MTTAHTKKVYDHGTYARYKLNNCRCYPCCLACSNYSQARQKAKAEGTWRVDGDLVRAHIRRLGEAGMGYKAVARQAGVSTTTVFTILHGRDGRPAPATTARRVAEKILAVHVELEPNALIDATGTIRRVQALVAIGHSITAVGREIGWTVQNLSPLITGSRKHPTIVVRTTRVVSAAYDRLAMIRPTGHSADRARNLGHARGWFPPLAWDDDTIDDPAGLPCLAPPVDGSNPDVDELTVQHAVAGHPIDLDPEVKAEVAWRLFAYGYPREHVASTLATSPNYVDQLRLRARRRAAQTATITEGVAA